MEYMLPNTKLTCAELVSDLYVCVCVRVNVADYWQIIKKVVLNLCVVTYITNIFYRLKDGQVLKAVFYSL